MPYTALQIHFPVRLEEKQPAESRGKSPVNVKATRSRETASPRIAVLSVKEHNYLGEWGWELQREELQCICSFLNLEF